MEEEDHLYSKRKHEIIFFGSCISISLENSHDCFISSQGFIDSNLYVKRFDSSSPESNFASSIFRILPFSNAQYFDKQNKLHDLLKNFDEEARKLSGKPLMEKKTEIQDLRTNLDVEINSNMTTYNKLKGTPVLFETSVFQLVHLATMKYLSLNNQSDNIYFELIDYPNENSFFKFNPSLKLQKQRSNFVYNDDLVTICRIPLYTQSLTTKISVTKKFRISNLVLRDDDPADQHKKKIIADIENSRKWK